MEDEKIYITKGDAVLALLEKGQHSKRYKLGETWELNFFEIQEAIDDMPSADVQPVKRGRWEQIGEQSAKCTACDCVLKSNGIDKTGKALIFKAAYHYCPYCGARMDGDTNG